MSTKSSILYGKVDGIDFHLYSECFEDDAIYLEMNGSKDTRLDFSASGNSLEVRLPLAFWEVIRAGTHSIMQSQYGGKTDKELLQIVTGYVDERIKAHKDGNQFASWVGSFTFGNAKDSRKKQIERGMKEARRVRNFVAKVKQAPLDYKAEKERETKERRKQVAAIEKKNARKAKAK